MDNSTLLITICLMAVVTAVPRVVPVLLLSGRKLPTPVMTWLEFVPVAVLSALLAPQIILRDGAVDLSFSNLYFWVALPAFLAGLVTKNLFITIMVGMGGIAVMRGMGLG